MRLTWDVEGRDWLLTLRLDPDESTHGTGQGGRSVTLITNRCAFRFADDLVAPHPDVLALAGISAAAPWIGSRVTFDRAVSRHLADVLERDWLLAVSPVDSSLEPHGGRRVGLAYSGGADSVAVGALIPDDSPYIHFERHRHRRVPNRATHLRVDVQAHLVRRAAERSREVHLVGSDLEFVVGPFPMFPEWTSVAIPVMLMSRRLDLGGIAFGTIMGSRYLSNGYRYRVPPANDRWANLFDAAGLPYVRPACGITEVSTIRMADESDIADLVRSCALGTPDGPCMNCKKCLRKELTAAGLEGRPLDHRLIANLGPEHPAVKELMEPPPYYFQHVLEFGLARARVEGTFLELVRDRLAPTEASTTWTTKYYAKSIEHDVPAALRQPILDRIQRHVPTMTAEEIDTVETWDAAGRSVTPRA